MYKTYTELENLLKTDERFVSQDGKVMRNAVYEAANKMDEKLLTSLIANPITKKMFFKEVSKALVFDKQEFNFVISNQEMLPDSYTAYRQDIGLVDSKNKFISSSNDVVLSFPFKDCVLEFDSTDPNQKREEVFINEVLGHDKIDHLFEKKVLSNARLINKKGESEIDSFSNNNTDNLLIKGNNLLAMHSLISLYKEKIKLIYWDILYNTENDQVPYADSFKHSSWLTMMKNRLEVTEQLLKDDGFICIQCDDNEMHYLKVILDEIYGRNNFLATLVIESGGALFGTKVSHINKTFVKQKDYILIYSKNEKNIHINPLYDLIEPYDTHFNKIIISPSETYTLLEYIKSDKMLVNAFEKYDIEIASENINRLMKIDLNIYNYFCDNIAPILFQDCPYTNELDNEDINNLKKFEIVVINGLYVHLTAGGKARFYKSLKDSINVADDYKGSFGRTAYRGDLWKGFSEDMKNVSSEGDVKLKNGKKPERLIANLLKALTVDGDIVLDSYFGTGTTGAVAMKMGRKFIGIEQLDAHVELAKARLTNVIKGDQTGISKSVNWQGGGEFVYCELKKLNQNFIDEIAEAKTKESLVEIWGRMQKTGFINCFVDIGSANELLENNSSINIDDIKKILISTLDKNQLYVNYSDMEDEDFKVSAADKKFTKSFYGINNESK